MTSPKHAMSNGYGRTYLHPVTGERAPSVTTIIGALDKPWMGPWVAKVSAAYAADNRLILAEMTKAEVVDLVKGAHKRISSDAADLGTAVHDTTDAWVNDRPMPHWAPGVEPFMEQFVDFLEARQPKFLETETTIWNRTHGYAGTLDSIAYINGHPTLLDTKTGKGVYPEVALQLAALKHGEFILRDDGTEDPMPQVTHAGVLHLRPSSWELIPVVVDDDVWAGFLAARGAWRFKAEVAGKVLGPALGRTS